VAVKRTVFLVEDEQDIRSLVRFHLEQDGYAVREAESGEEALRSVLARSSFLVDGNPVGGRAPEAVLLEDAAVVEVLPPFAGG